MPITTLLLLFLTAALTQLARGIDDISQHGVVRDELFSQHLSHLAFHSGAMKLELAALVAAPSPTPRTVAVVGVEWGSEVAEFAERGYRVHAVEPLPQFIAHLERLITSNPHWDVHLSPVAAVSKRDIGNITLAYDNADTSASVRTATLDDIITHDGELDVLSVDVQGAELDVLLGANSLLTGPVPRVRSLWIEVGACNEKVMHIMHMLDEHYALFDFVPWGQATAEPHAGVPRSRASFLVGEKGNRPAHFQPYWQWMCDAQKKAYRWLQTDFVAVRRDLVTKDTLDNIRGIATRLCGVAKGSSNCALREMVLQEQSLKTEL